ncbi:MAG: Ig-like domain-containing protein [Lachnospiraceae bacterium]|nr:Ig-like domain-containing protein [Lachnospiraceae bacterium]
MAFYVFRENFLLSGIKEYRSFSKDQGTGMKKGIHTGALRILMLMFFATLCLFAPAGTPLASATGTVTAEAATETSVKSLTAGKSCTITGYAKVTSSKTSVATSKKKSSKKYTVKAVKKGTAVLKCYDADGKLVKKIYLIVTTQNSLKYNTSTTVLVKGKTKTVTATVQSGCTVKYASSKTGVAAVNSKGKITAKKVGTATISAKVYYKGKVIRTFKKKVVVVSYDTSDVKLSVGDSTRAEVSVPSGYTVSYASSDKSVARVSSKGKIAAKKAGTATITAKISYNGNVIKKLTKTVTVTAASGSTSSGSTSTAPALTYTFDSSAVTICMYEGLSAEATVSSGYSVSYASSNPSVASVDVKGFICGLSEGTTSITVNISYNGTVKKTLTKKVTVVYPEYILSNKKTATAYVSPGGSVSNTVDLSFSKGWCNSWISYESSDTSVATTAENGAIEAISPGTATITGTLKLGTNLSNAKVVETWRRDVVVTQNSLNYSELSLYMDVNDSETILCQNVNSSDDVEWSCSDSSVLETYSTVQKERVITALKKGTATITCTVNSCTTLTCKVTVTNKYSYDIYLVNADEIYSSDVYGCHYCFFIKTENPSVSYLSFRGTSIYTAILDTYDDIPEVRSHEVDNFYPVSGGYIYSAQFRQSGRQTVSLIIGSNIIKTFSIDVLDYRTAMNEWIDGLIDDYTTSDMTSFEKMSSICKYLVSDSAGFKYPANDGTSFLTLSTETGPSFIKKIWDSASSPSMLARIAERIGGFDYIHNCYTDYTYGTEEWKVYHACCAVGIGDTTLYYEVCPSWSTGTITSITYVDLNSTENLKYVG